MLRRLLAYAVLSALVTLPLPVQATSTIKRVSLVGLTAPIAYPGKLFFTTGTTPGLYRVSIYADVTQAVNNGGSITVNWYCPTAFGSGGSSWPFGVSTVGNQGFNEGLVRPNNSASCYYWIDFQNITEPVQFNLYFTVEKI
jgi:hypothetical protein